MTTKAPESAEAVAKKVAPQNANKQQQNKKSQQKAERKAHQNEKNAQQGEKKQQGEKRPQQNKKQPQNKKESEDKKATEASQAAATSKKEKTIDALFSHIQTVKKWSTRELLEPLKEADREKIHYKLLEYALQTAQDVTLDENEKCIRFMKMIRQQVIDEPPSVNGRFIMEISYIIKRTVTLLSRMRMMTPGVGNATRYLKNQIRKITNDDDTLKKYMVRMSITDETKLLREVFIEAIDQFIEDKITDVSQHLLKKLSENIVDGDVILTYGWSPMICQAILLAHQTKKVFRVIVVDSRPNFDARKLTEMIPEIDFRYVLISGLSYMMPEATKVLIEPCGILSNNAALATIGTAMVSMVAHEYGVPVVFVCPSYRFVSDVRIDALAKNEILGGDYVGYPDTEYLSLMYDVTPGQFVDVVISELGSIPVNSISTNIKFIQDSYTMYSRTVAALISREKPANQ